MWLFPVIVTAMLLPALVALVFYLLTLARRIDDPEIKARRRWRMISRGNAVWILAIIAGLIAIAQAPIQGFAPAARAAASIPLSSLPTALSSWCWELSTGRSGGSSTPCGDT